MGPVWPSSKQLVVSEIGGLSEGCLIWVTNGYGDPWLSKERPRVDEARRAYAVETLPSGT